MSAKAEKAILRSDLPAISLLVEVEFYSAVARKRREGALSEADATSIVTKFRLHIDEGIMNCFRLMLRTMRSRAIGLGASSCR